MIKKIGIIGLGSIGSKLAVYLSTKGIEILAYCHHNLELHKGKIENILKKYDNIPSKLMPIIITSDISLLRDVDLIIDSSLEDYQVKKDIYNNICTFLGKNIVIGCTTSSLDLNKLANYYQPENFFGLHFFNPPDKMQLIEISYSSNISPKCLLIIKDIKDILTDKVIIELPMIQGYVVNRILFVYLNYAYNFQLETKLEFDLIDKCMKLGSNVPMGPFQLSDYIGIDVCFDILNELYNSLKNEIYKPSQLLYEFIEKGNLGKKTKKGFYTY